MSSSIQANAVDKFLTSFITKRLQDRDKSGTVTDEEKALFTYSPKAKALGDVLCTENNPTVSWADVNSKLEDLQANLAQEQETAKLMYNLDSDHDGEVKYSEIIAAKDTNKHAANLINLFQIDEKDYDEDDVFDFTQMQNYVDLIDVNDDNDVTTSSAKSEFNNFGSLVTSTRVKIGGSVQEVSNIRGILQKFLNGGSKAVTDLEMELINQVKAGSYTEVSATNTWDYVTEGTNQTKQLDTNDDFVLLLRQSAQDNGYADDVEIYDLDNAGGLDEDGKTQGRLVIALKDENGDVIKEYRLDKNTTITEDDIWGQLEEYEVGRGDEDEVGTNEYVKSLLLSGDAAVLKNAEYDSDGKIINFTSEGAKFDVAYNSDGTVSVVRRGIVGEDRDTTVTTYNANNKPISQKVFDEEGEFVKTVNYYYSSSNDKDPQEIVNYSSDSYPKVSQNESGKYTKVTFKDANGKDVKVDLAEKENVIIFANGFTKIGDVIYDKYGVKTTLTGKAFEKLEKTLPGYSVANISNFTYDAKGKNVTEIEYDGKKYQFTYDSNGDIETWTEVTKTEVTGVTERTIHDKSGIIKVTNQSEEIENSPQLEGTKITFPAGGKAKSVTLNTGDVVVIHANGNVEITNDSKHIVYNTKGQLLASITDDKITFGEDDKKVEIDKPAGGSIMVDAETGNVTIAKTTTGENSSSSVEKFDYNPSTGALTSSYTASQTCMTNNEGTTKATVSMKCKKTYDNTGNVTKVEYAELQYNGKKLDLDGSNVDMTQLTQLSQILATEDENHNLTGELMIYLRNNPTSLSDSITGFIGVDKDGNWTCTSTWDSEENTWTFTEKTGGTFSIQDDGTRGTTDDTPTTSLGSDIKFKSKTGGEVTLNLANKDKATIAANGSVTVVKDDGTKVGYNQYGEKIYEIKDDTLTFTNSTTTPKPTISCLTGTIVEITGNKGDAELTITIGNDRYKQDGTKA